MGSAISTTGLIPMLFSLAGVIVTLRYLKGMSELSLALRYLLLGFVFVVVSKLIIFVRPALGDHYFYFINLFCHLLYALFFTAAAFSIKGINLFNKTVNAVAIIASLGWSWYVVLKMGDSNLLIFSMILSSIGYGALAIAFWRRKTLRNSLGFVLAGWICIFLGVYNIVGWMSWGQTLQSPIFETFLYIAFMCGMLLISNNMMAHQFDTLTQEIKDNKERLRLMVQLSPFPIIISRLKGDQLMLMNESAAKLFGVNMKNPGNFKLVDYFAEPSKRTELLVKLEKHPVVDDFEFLVKPKQGEPFWLLVSARVFDYEYDVALYMAFQDITDRKKKELQLFNQATRDPLTNCYNRRQFEEMAKNEVQRSRRYHHPFCLFMIDADHFKNVNDTHGHAVGDLVLQALADCCRRTLRESDIIARFGGEEFVILLPEASIENGHRVAERLRIKISKLVVKNEQNQDVRFTVSIGLVASTVTDNIAEMLKMSDEALYEAKENGRNQVVIYDVNGPNRSIPAPEGEDIDKVINEPLFNFKPSSAPVVRNQEEEHIETGVVGLDGSATSYRDEELDHDEDVKPMRGEGVSLNSLYDTDEDEEGPIYTAPVPSAPPVLPPFMAEQETFEDVEEKIEAEIDLDVSAEIPDEIVAEPVEEEFDYDISLESEEADKIIYEDIPQEADQIPELAGEVLPEPDLPVEEPEIIDEESVIEPEIPVIAEEQPDIEPIEKLTEELVIEPPLPAEESEEKVLIPPLSFEDDLPVSEDDLPEEPPLEEDVSFHSRAPAFEEHDEIYPMEPSFKIPEKPKTIMKKVPIKMPKGLVKVPKMPGVVKVKIPKALHQKPMPPKPEN